LHRGDQSFSAKVTSQTPEFFSRDDNNFVTAMYRHVLRPLAANPPDQFAQTRLGILKNPTTRTTLARAPTGFRRPRP
jgi:hypothetical protein